jgi:hypothetical protein
MNNLNSHANFESSPIASPMAPNFNASLTMFGGRRKRYKKKSKKGGMDPKITDTPEKDKSSRVTPFLGNPKNLFGNKEIIEEDLIEENPEKNDTFSLEVADDKDYDNLENIMVTEQSIPENIGNRMDIEEDVLSKMESGDLDSKKGGSRRQKYRTNHNKTKKLSKKNKKTKRRTSTKKSRKSRRLCRK